MERVFNIVERQNEFKEFCWNFLQEIFNKIIQHN